MDRKLGFLLVCGMLALGLFVPGVSHGEEAPGCELIAPVTEGAPQVGGGLLQEEQPITLEELEQMVGAHKVCSFVCGPRVYPPTNCSQVCGDPATCYHGYCIYL